MEIQGHLRDIGRDVLATVSTVSSVLVIYHRTSTLSITHRSCASIAASIESWTPPPADVEDLTGSDSESVVDSSNNHTVAGSSNKDIITKSPIGEEPSMILFKPVEFWDQIMADPKEESDSDSDTSLHDSELIHSTLKSDSGEYHCAGCDMSGKHEGSSGLDSHLSNDGFIGCDKCDTWSHVLCIETQFGLPRDWQEASAQWLCPICTEAARWEESLLQKWVLLPLSFHSTMHGRPGKLYACKLCGIDASDALPGPHVVIEWYYGNSYPAKGLRPAQPRTSIPAHRVAHAVASQAYDSMYSELSDSQVATVKWPSRLQHFDANMPRSDGYQNKELSSMLEDSFQSVVDICKGTRKFHHILEDYGIALGQGGDKVRKTSVLHSHMPLLPGDESLIVPFIDRLALKLQSTSISVSSEETAPSSSVNPVDLATGIGKTLFSLVILRSYLGRPPCDDITIYSLFWSHYVPINSAQADQAAPRIIRRLTVPEEALATVLQWTNEERLAPNASRRLSAETDRRRHVKSLPCHYDIPLAYVRAESPFVWPNTNDPGLTSTSPHQAEDVAESAPAHAPPKRVVAHCNRKEDVHMQDGISQAGGSTHPHEVEAHGREGVVPLTSVETAQGLVWRLAA
ncbi:hypothetical protein C8Q80DRAFT_1189104 [Daedaleopsis nitida]|nr:hypothetical protein C8Q80DRAFT_1189104 [Daedaleopsis nitida]